MHIKKGFDIKDGKKKIWRKLTAKFTVLKLEHSDIRPHVLMNLLHPAKLADISAKRRKDFLVHHFAGLLQMRQNSLVHSSIGEVYRQKNSPKR